MNPIYFTGCFAGKAFLFVISGPIAVLKFCLNGWCILLRQVTLWIQSFLCGISHGVDMPWIAEESKGIEPAVLALY